MPHLQKEKDCVRYYYLPARHGNSAEIIEVLNSHHSTIDVPTLEEDLILEPFHTRLMTLKETKEYKDSETWVVFSSWDELQADHVRFEVRADIMTSLSNFRVLLSCSEDLVT